MRSARFIIALFTVALIAVGARAITTVIPTDVVIQGNLAAKAFTVPSGSIADSQVAAGAAVSASKLQHAEKTIFAQGSATTVTAATQVVFVVVGATGTVQVAEAGAVVPAIGTDTCTVDVKKNGTTILSSPISLTSSQTARQVVAGTVTTASCVVGDVFEVVITPTHSTGTLAQGVFVTLDVFEAAQ